MRREPINVAAEYMKVSDSHIRKLIRTDSDFPAYKVGWVWRVDMDALDEWIKQPRENVKPIKIGRRNPQQPSQVRVKKTHEP